MLDILIIGAGSSGLCAAKTFLKYNEDENILLVDAHASLGGVWSKEQLYPTLKTNNLHPSVDFFDLPMDERFGIKPGEHVTGEAMNRYLCAYADHFGLTERIQLRTRVIEVCQRPAADGWTVRLERDGLFENVECRKLVVATGVLSVPHRPDLEGVAQFDALYLHSSELGPKADELVRNPDIKTVAVLGGCKSAYDAVYLAASTGHKVEWIIRKSGRGPTWVFPTHTYLGPFKAWREALITRRIFAFMSPWPFPDFSGLSWLRNFLHFSLIGRKISQTFWSLIHADTIHDCQYRTDSRLNILEPEQSPFWYGTASGTLNYETSFASYVQSGQVQVHREDISHLSPQTIHLSSGTELSVDALVACTGYSAKPTINFVPASTHSNLGIPTSELNKTQLGFWQDLCTRADLTIGARFPSLLRGPSKGPGSSTPVPYNPGAAGEAKYTPWRLYRGIAPPGLAAAGDRSLVFLGMFSNIANTIRLEIQCLWALAYLEGKLPAADADMENERIFDETALFQRFTELRAPYGHGRLHPDLSFDQLPYFELLLSDLGLKTQRKANWFRELFEPYSQRDYAAIVEEWISSLEPMPSHK